jgi:hypothetical protein
MPIFEPQRRQGREERIGKEENLCALGVLAVQNSEHLCRSSSVDRGANDCQPHHRTMAEGSAGTVLQMGTSLIMQQIPGFLVSPTAEPIDVFRKSRAYSRLNSSVISHRSITAPVRRK